jgi:hypothetical protein
MTSTEPSQRLSEAVRCVGSSGLYVYIQCGRKTRYSYGGKPLCGQHKPREL